MDVCPCAAAGGAENIGHYIFCLYKYGSSLVKYLPKAKKLDVLPLLNLQIGAEL